MTDKEFYQLQRLAELKDESKKLQMEIRKLARKEFGENYVTDFYLWDVGVLRGCMKALKYPWRRSKEDKCLSIQGKINHFAFSNDVVKRELAKLGY